MDGERGWSGLEGGWDGGYGHLQKVLSETLPGLGGLQDLVCSHKVPGLIHHEGAVLGGPGIAVVVVAGRLMLRHVLESSIV